MGLMMLKCTAVDRQSQQFFFCFQRCNVLYDMFRPTWPSSGNIHCVRNIWEEIMNVTYYKTNLDHILPKIVVIFKVMLQKKP